MGRLGLEPRTSRLKAECSTTELATRWGNFKSFTRLAQVNHFAAMAAVIAYRYFDTTWENLAEDSELWGQEVERIYIDVEPQRPHLHALLQELKPGEVSYFLLCRLDELADSIADVGDRLGQLEQLGIQVMAIDQPYRTGVSSRPQVLSELFETLEQQQRSRQIRQGHARSRLKFLPPPGRVPYGYRRGKERYIIDRQAAIIVKDFFDHFLLYGSLRSAVRFLEQAHQKKISVTTGQRWLTHPVYRGDLCYKNNDIIRDAHAPILSREEAAQVDRLLRRNRSLPKRSASAPYALAGLVRCEACGSSFQKTRVTAYRKQREYTYLRPCQCPQTPKCPSLGYDRLLEQTITQICQDLPPAIASLKTTGLEARRRQLQARIKEINGAISQLENLVETSILDADTARLRRYKLRSELATLENQQSQLPPENLRQIAANIGLPQFWYELSATEQRFYFREFIRAIQITYDNEASEAKTWQLSLRFMF